MKTALVGYTGFVGSNLNCLYQFTNLYNSKNIHEAYDTEPDLLVYAGLPSEMFKANANPDDDYKNILQAIKNIEAIKPKKLVLISTVAVYDKTNDVDEKHIICKDSLLPYGRNRLILEEWVLDNYYDSLVVRLPAIYGLNLKKNFIFDLINVIPVMLTENKYFELCKKSALIEQAYRIGSDKFYYLNADSNVKKQIYNYFSMADFNAIKFTDNRSIYQFYNLKRLWKDITIALNNNIKLINMVTEPISAAEIYKSVTGNDFINELSKPPFDYKIKSAYASLFGGDNGYMVDKTEVLSDLQEYIVEEKKRLWG